MTLSRRQIETLTKIMQENPSVGVVQLIIDRSSGYGTEIKVEYGDNAAEITEFD